MAVFDTYVSQSFFAICVFDLHLLWMTLIFFRLWRRVLLRGMFVYGGQCMVFHALSHVYGVPCMVFHSRTSYDISQASD